MFGFSLQKLLFTALAIAAVWYGYKWLGRVQEIRAQRAQSIKKQGRVKPRQSPGAAEAPDTADAAGAEEMIQCPVCEAFVAARGAVSCGREGCPYPG